MPRVLNPKASGQTINEAVIIEALSIDDGIAEEYKYLEKRFGKRGKDWQVFVAAVDYRNGKIYDVLYLGFPDNKRPKEWKLDQKDPFCLFFYPFYFLIVSPYEKFNKNIAKIRKKWRPKKVKVLFVGESPPAERFFYECDSKLYKAIKKAFEKARGKEFDSDEEFLQFFKSKGCYLEDLCDRRGLHRFERKIRREIRKRCEPLLARRIEKLKPNKIVVVMKSIKDNVLNAIRFSKLDKYPEIYVLKFPRGERLSKEFVKKLSKWLKNNRIC